MLERRQHHGHLASGAFLERGGDPALELAARRRGDPASRRRPGSGRGPAAWYRRRRSRARAPRGRRSRDRIDPRASRQGPRARARRPAGRGSRGSRAAGWHRRRAPASWPPRPRRRRARRPRPRRAGRARTASRRPAPRAPTPRAAPIPARLDTSRTPSSRSSGRTCRVTSGRLVADDGRQRCRETVGDGRGPGRDHERQAPTRAGRRPDQEVAQGERERVDPLEVVDEQGRGTLPGELSMDRLEDPDGVEAADLGAGVEQAMERPILAGRREPAEQRGRRGQRHARLRLVAGEPVDPVAVERPPGFVEEPRLPDPGVPHEEQRADASFAPRRRDQRADGRHLVRPTDEHLAHAVRLRRPAIVSIAFARIRRPMRPRGHPASVASAAAEGAT